VALQAEEQRPGPAGSGDETSDLRQALVAGTLIFVASLYDRDDVSLILPLTDEANPGLKGRARAIWQSRWRAVGLSPLKACS
jgi:hypothetical protein